ncbi:type II toxin-antitoxin system RelE family toxin [Caldinitratiruptor microaerophilus]|uniref:DNA 3'-5' helicase n=1 Tax=Caldinitratiruptor microaerophilus TaxID=671077 RepID=A0AA35CL38_9FIRM|nr:3'-5' exonuclease [Caldinitratiruptor microaerophilus]BDG59502.1 hypothetical protein caldi_05920 [Caldinitratiruptor microaerophilus]
MRELTIKPSGLNDLFSLPRDVYPMVLEKVKRLQEDPRPDGHVKKKVVQHPNLYRLRAGDFRIFYTFDDGAVYLLAIRRRQEATYAAHEVPAAVASGPSPDLPAVPDDLPDEDGTGLPAASRTVAEQTAAALAQPAAPRPLPRAITPEWLRDLLIPPEFHPELCRCRHEDDLLDARVPAWVQERVLDNLYPRTLGERLAQPDLVVPEAEDLQRYREGDLLGFLLRLDPEQARRIDGSARGPAGIKGGPGSGKSTVALYRVRRILDRAAAGGGPAPRILFNTFTNALTRFSEQLLRQLLGERAQLVTVSTADHVARTVLSHVENVPEPADRQSLLHILGEVRSRFVPPAPGRFEQAARKAALDRLRADRTCRGVPLPTGLREAARYMTGNDLDLEAPEVKVMTLHSAKGLEFPIVAVLGLRDGTIPRVPPDLSAEEVEEETQAFRRLLFVGLTRAMRALLVCYPVSRPSPFVAELDPAYWQVGWAVPGS